MINDRQIREWVDAHWEEIERALEQDDMIGFCVSCGAETHGVEPDARAYRCEYCGAQNVFGVSELLFYVTI